jgi:hypothetical protein
VTISRNRSDKILHKRPGGHGLGEPGITLGHGGDPQRQSDPAAAPLAFLEEFVAAEVGATAAEEALHEVKMALDARVLTRPPICSSALVVAVMKAGRVTCWWV